MPDLGFRPEDARAIGLSVILARMREVDSAEFKAALGPLFFLHLVFPECTFCGSQRGSFSIVFVF